jgi:hypothetical protein
MPSVKNSARIDERKVPCLPPTRLLFIGAMRTKSKLSPREAMEREKARLLEEAAAKAAAIDRDMAELERIVAKYDLDLTAARKAAASSNNESELDIANLAHRYQADKNSPYARLRYRTREHYRSCLKRIIADCGEDKLAKLKRSDIQRLHNGWSVSGPAMAHAILAVFRILINYGTTVLEDSECERLAGVLHAMRFKTSKPRKTEYLTEEQVTKIVNKAHQMGHHSLALAQAFQFDCKLGQRDVIGEWVPNSEPGVSDVIHENAKWLRGIRWDEITNLILRHTISKNLSEIEVDLRKAPTVLRELALLGPAQRKGPIVISEQTDLPYKAHDFRALWRKVANAAGIPKSVKNMDSRGKEKSRNDSSDNAKATAH